MIAQAVWHAQGAMLCLTSHDNDYDPGHAQGRRQG